MVYYRPDKLSGVGGTRVKPPVPGSLTSSLLVRMVMKGKGMLPRNLAPTLNSSGGSLVKDRCSSCLGGSAAAAAPAPTTAAGTPSAANAPATAPAAAACAAVMAVVGDCCEDVLGCDCCCCCWAVRLGMLIDVVSAVESGGGGAKASEAGPYTSLTDPGCRAAASQQQQYSSSNAAGRSKNTAAVYVAATVGRSHKSLSDRNPNLLLCGLIWAALGTSVKLRMLPTPTVWYTRAEHALRAVRAVRACVLCMPAPEQKSSAFGPASSAGLLCQWLAAAACDDTCCSISL